MRNKFAIKAIILFRKLMTPMIMNQQKGLLHTVSLFILTLTWHLSDKIYVKLYSTFYLLVLINT